MPSFDWSSDRSEEHTSELQSHDNLVCRLLLEKKKKTTRHTRTSKHCETHTSHTEQPVRVWCTVASSEPAAGYGCSPVIVLLLLFFFFNDTAPPEIYTFSLHDALPISTRPSHRPPACGRDWPKTIW